MNTNLLAKLEIKMQEFLEENADAIGSCHGIWVVDYGGTESGRNAALMAKSASIVIDAQELHLDLTNEMS